MHRIDQLKSLPYQEQFIYTRKKILNNIIQEIPIENVEII